MKLSCLFFGHDTLKREVLDQPNKKVMKIKVNCSTCDKDMGTLTWPSPMYIAEYVEGVFEMPADDDQGCTVPPPGWYCTRKPGHDGPCAAKPTK